MGREKAGFLSEMLSFAPLLGATLHGHQGEGATNQTHGDERLSKTMLVWSNREGAKRLKPSAPVLETALKTQRPQHVISNGPPRRGHCPGTSSHMYEQGVIICTFNHLTGVFPYEQPTACLSLHDQQEIL